MNPLTSTQLKHLMRLHRVTIRELSRRIGIPMRRIREYRDGKARLGLIASMDWWQAITGADRLTPRMRAQLKQHLKHALVHVDRLRHKT